jgi:hypothetical protein
MDVHRNDPRLPNPLDPQRLSPELLQSVFSLNEQLLELLSYAAQTTRHRSPLVESLYETFRGMDANTRVQLSRAPLLIDAGFGIPDRWSDEAHQASSHRRARPEHWLARSKAVALARSTFTIAWHSVHTFPHVARLLLGMCDPCISFFDRATVSDIQRLSERRYEWIRPRWELQPEIWRELIALARHPPKLLPGSVVLRAMGLIAAEVRRNQSNKTDS